MAKKKAAKVKTLTNAGDIAQLIVDTIVLAIEDAGYTIIAAAFSEWQPKLKTSVQNRLNAGGQWTPNVEKKVLDVARDMAAIAVIISDDDPEIPKSRLHAAFRAAKASKKCPGGSGAGAWCDFSI
jgi:hypothetical protein